MPKRLSHNISNKLEPGNGKSRCFLAVKTGRFRGMFLPIVAEALAIKEALSWVQGKGWSNVICESDSLTVVHNNVESDSLDFTSFGALVDDIKMLLIQFQGNCRVVALPRQAYMAAHELAQAIRIDEFVGEWFHNPPNIVRDVLLADSI
ncbi:hypothetical protein K2173_013473 [Erythroxylum novogranatense]|uniref:RNase H type-1 domain-containing protein n=1 Tax=Erythroxylum novogranatense TaxID=1862640 RepID=A0AAV8SAC5_9ROSI|nr:hypothetical protein K2173_013473 [Erythroxylum novogranatense]